MHRSMTLKQRITLGLAAFLLALAVQIFLSFYQSGTVMQRLDDQMGQFNAISRFQGGVERGLTVLGDYRWEYGDADPEGHRIAYAQAYYGKANALTVSKCLAGYADHTVSYGEHPDDHAGDQFYNHVPRMLIAQFLRDRTQPSEDLQWLCDRPALSGQAAWCGEKYREAEQSYEQYLRQCEAAAATMTGAARALFQDTLLLQAQLYALWAQGGAAVCAALEAGFVGDWKRCFYYAGRAKKLWNLRLCRKLKVLRHRNRPPKRPSLPRAMRRSLPGTKKLQKRTRKR